MIIDGRAIAREIVENLKNQPRPNKTLAAIFVGDNPQSQSFLRQKEKIATELGIEFRLIRFPESISQPDLISEIKKIGADGAVGGMIVQLPLPAKFNRDTVIVAVNPLKDVDALTPVSQQLVDPLPVAVVKEILKRRDINIKDKVMVVVGRGFLVGKPIANYFLGKCKELILLHSKSGLSEVNQGDVVITGVGKGGLITPEMLKPGAGVIDFGYDFNPPAGGGKIMGDFNPEPYAISHKPLAFYTPTPGGTGPILVAKIFDSFYKLNSL